MPLHQRRKVAVLSTGQQIAFPVAGYRSVFRLRGALSNGDGIDDLTPAVAMFTGMTRAAHAPLRPQVVHQLFLQYSSRLNEQAAINSLGGHAHTLVVGITGLQPSGNLFR